MVKKASDSIFFRSATDKDFLWNERFLSKQAATNSLLLNEVRKKTIGEFEKAHTAGEIKALDRVRCSCGSSEMKMLSSFDRFQMDFSSNICMQCGLVMTSPYLDEGSLKHYYETFYHKLHFGEERVDSQEYLFRRGQGAKIFKIVNPFFENVKDISILEIGFGTGNVLSEFKQAASEHDLKVDELGTEFSKECIDIAGQKELNVIKGSFDEVVTLKRKFDLVILSHVFEHFIDPQDTLESLKKVLKPNGVVYVEVPGLMTIHKKGEYEFDFQRYLTHAHIFNFNLVSLTRIFNQGGFRLVKGNEEIEAVFKEGEQKVDTTNNAEVIMGYLHFMEHIRGDSLNRHQLLSRTQKLLNKTENVLGKTEHVSRQNAAMLKITTGRLAKMENTLSWKITNPLRWLSKVMRMDRTYNKKVEKKRRI